MGTTVFDLAEENGGAGFWISKPSWFATIAHVVYVGPALELGNDPDAQIVLMDIYNKFDGDLKDELLMNKSANRADVWDEDEQPDWTGHKEPRKLDDPAIVASLPIRRDGKGALAPKTAGKIQVGTFRILAKGRKNLTMESADQSATEWAEHILPLRADLKDLEVGIWYDIEVEMDKEASHLPSLGTKQYYYFGDANVVGKSHFDGVCARAETIVSGIEETFKQYGDLEPAQKKALKRYAAVPEYKERMAAIQNAMPTKAPAKRRKKIAIEEVTEGVFTIFGIAQETGTARMGTGKASKYVSLRMGSEKDRILTDTPVHLRVRYVPDAPPDSWSQRPLLEVIEFVSYDLTDLQAAKLADEIEGLINEGKMLGDRDLLHKMLLMRGRAEYIDRMRDLKRAADYTEAISKIRFMEEANKVAKDYKELCRISPDFATSELFMFHESKPLEKRFMKATTVKKLHKPTEEDRTLLESHYEHWRMPDMKRGFCLFLPVSQEVELGKPAIFGKDTIVPSFEGRRFKIQPYHVLQYGWHLKDHIGEFGRFVYGRPLRPEELAA